MRKQQNIVTVGLLPSRTLNPHMGGKIKQHQLIHVTPPSGTCTNLNSGCSSKWSTSPLPKYDPTFNKALPILMKKLTSKHLGLTQRGKFA